MDPGAIGKPGNKIDDARTSTKVSGDAGAANSGAKGRVATNDTVNLTSSAKLIERLEKNLASLPEIDSARVAEIKTAIENGEYQIDADAISAAMIRFERSFGE